MEVQSIEARQEAIQAEIADLFGNNHVGLLVHAEIQGEQVWIVGYGFGDGAPEIGRITEEEFYSKKAEGDVAVLRALGYKIGE